MCWKSQLNHKTLDIYRASICLLTLLKKSFYLRGGKRNWTFDGPVGVPLDSICQAEGLVAVSPELKHPTTKHLGQILGNKIPRIFHTRTPTIHTYVPKGRAVHSLLDQAGDRDHRMYSLDYRFPGRGEDDAAEL